MTLLPHALALASRGFQITPLHDAGTASAKKPRLNNWQNTATTDPIQIAQWWASHPAANVGAAMGGPSRLVAIDVDGDVGVQSWTTLEAGRGVPTLISLSGSGKGCHRIFRAQPHQDLGKIRNSVKFRLGLDVRATGGQVVVPPSVHPSGQAYEWLDPNAPVADLPDWLYEAIAADPAPERKATTDHTPRSDPPVAMRKARALIALSRLPPAVQGESGHTTLLKTTRVVYRGYDLPRADAKDLLVTFYNPRCSPPWEGTELHREFDRKLDEIEKGDDPWGADLDAELFAEPTAAAPLVVSALASRIDKLGHIGPRMPTGIPTLDRVTRGGLTQESVVVFGGAPGACKTTLVVHQAVHHAQQGRPVAILAADEGPNGLLIRIGQVLGLEREAVEQGTAGEAFKQRVASLPLNIYSTDDPGVTIESVAEELAKQGPGVLVIDSLQTARTKTSGKATDGRSRLDDVVAVIKQCAMRYKHAVLVTSELSRASYRSKVVAEQIDDLAAFKESGSIEYAGTVLLVLRNPKGSGGVVDVTMPKNRLGFEKADFRLQLDPDRATLSEVDKPAPEPEPDPITKRQVLERQIWNLVRDNPNIISKRMLADELRHTGISVGNDALFLAVDRLISKRVLVKDEAYRIQPWASDPE